MKQVEVKEVEDGSGDVYIEFPQDILDGMGWKEGDELKFTDNRDGTFSITKLTLESIELEFDDDELFKYMQHAHKMDMSFNEWINQALKTVLQQCMNED